MTYGVAMDNIYYQTLNYCNDYPYIRYRWDINWNVEAITGEQFADGYIVQKVSISTSTKLSTVNNTSYFEAWKVEKGICEKEFSCDYDDSFSCRCDGFSGWLNHIKDALGKIGDVKYTGVVYWISQESLLYSEIDSWRKGTVQEAGNLKSSYQFNEKKIEPICIREYTHHFSLVDEMIIKQIILDECCSLYNPTRDRYYVENFELVINDLLENTAFSYLIQSISDEWNKRLRSY